ncbi:hypothetical protein VIGAN_07235100, partial [Vigna angularis var. angularis]
NFLCDEVFSFFSKQTLCRAQSRRQLSALLSITVVDDNINLKTCKNCKTQFDLSLNHPLASQFHTAHFEGCRKHHLDHVKSFLRSKNISRIFPSIPT